MIVTDFQGLITTLLQGRVEFIIVGGVAALGHGSVRLTTDLDVVYRRTPANLERTAATLATLNPYLRGAPAGLPFRWDAQTLRNGLNFTLVTSLGWVDLLGEITGGGTYEALEPHCLVLELFGYSCLCLGLDKLIEVKRAAGRPKDFEAIAELEKIRDHQNS